MVSSVSYTRAALLVDFDNIYTSLRKLDLLAARVFANDPLRWATWIEERLGAVGPDSSEGTPRVLLQKICYLNPSVYGGFRPYFTRAGFRVVDCPSLTSQGKSSADIHMVIDALDLLAHPVGYDEFIVLSLDADFTPLFQRLRSFDRRVIMLGSGPSSAALRNTCDYVIPDEVFISEALLDEQPFDIIGLPTLAVQGGDDPAPAAGIRPVQAHTVAPAHAMEPAERSSADEDQLREKLAEALRQMVATVSEPVRMAHAANTLRVRFGQQVTAG